MKVYRKTIIKSASAMILLPQLILAVALLSGCAAAPMPLQAGQASVAPLGCTKMKGCGDAQAITRAAPAKPVLQSVLDEAQRGHRYVEDGAQYGGEHWTPNLIGDCEDFALVVRAMLQRIGIGSDLVYAKVPGRSYHVVVHVDGYILDNRHKWVMRTDDLDYQWLTIGKSSGGWWLVSSTH